MAFVTLFFPNIFIQNELWIPGDKDETHFCLLEFWFLQLLLCVTFAFLEYIISKQLFNELFIIHMEIDWSVL